MGLDRAGRILFIDGVQVSTSEYPSEHAAKRFRSGVSERGDETPTVKYGKAIVQFGGRPHWFDEGRLVVPYLGDDRSTVRALRLVLGPQFAGL
jgi:hypothetical protein